CIAGRPPNGGQPVQEVACRSREACSRIRSQPRFRIASGVCLNEAHKMLFWNYYRNEKDSENIRWGQGLHRYLSDEQAVNILKDIVEIKAGTAEEQLAKDFLDYFCSVNALDQNEISPKSGALVLRKNK
ncbi:MAG: hypothetical protein ACI4TP_04365, partial [Anaerotignum sp.]